MYRLIVSCYTSTFLSKPFFGLFKFHRATSSASIKANANDYSSLSSAEKCQSDNESPSVITVKSNPNLKDEEQHLEVKLMIFSPQFISVKSNFFISWINCIYLKFAIYD